MANITLAGKCWADQGAEFVYIGDAPECGACKVVSVCHNLQPGRRYRIVELRDTVHECAIHEGGAVVVEFELLPVQVALETVKALEGAVITFHGNSCKRLNCPEHMICDQVLVQKETRIKLLSLGRELECPEGKKMVAVDIEEAK